MLPDADELRAWCVQCQAEVEIVTEVGIFLVNARGINLVELGLPRRATVHELRMYLEDADPDHVVGVAGAGEDVLRDVTLGELALTITTDLAEPVVPEPFPAAVPASQLDLALQGAGVERVD